MGISLRPLFWVWSLWCWGSSVGPVLCGCLFVSGGEVPSHSAPASFCALLLAFVAGFLGAVFRGPRLLLSILQRQPAENSWQEYPQCPSLPLVAHDLPPHPYSFTWIPEWATGECDSREGGLFLPCWLGCSSQPVWKARDLCLGSYLFPNAGYICQVLQRPSSPSSTELWCSAQQVYSQPPRPARHSSSLLEEHPYWLCSDGRDSFWSIFYGGIYHASVSHFRFRFR